MKNILAFALAAFVFLASFAAATNNQISVVAPANQSVVVAGSNQTFNASLGFSGAGLSNFTWNLNGTNYTPYDANLILMYNFDNVSALGENDTLVADLSARMDNATLVGSPALNASGKFGGGLYFDGTGTKYAALNYSMLAGATSYTISLWFDSANAYFDALLTIEAATSWRLAAYSNYFRLRDNDGSTHDVVVLGTIPANQWTHLTMVYDGANSKFYTYINAGSKTTTTVGTAMKTDFDSFKLGRNDDGNVYAGSIDELRIWSRPLSDAEVSENYRSNLQKYSATDWTFTVNETLSAVSTYSYAAFTESNRTAGIAYGATGVSACRDLNVTGAVYKLSANVSWNAGRAICFNITADNVLFDLGGYSISGNGNPVNPCVMAMSNNSVIRNGMIGLSSRCGTGVNITGSFTTVYNVTFPIAYGGAGAVPMFGVASFRANNLNISGNLFSMSAGGASSYPAFGVAMNDSLNSVVSYNTFKHLQMYIVDLLAFNTNYTSIEHNEDISGSNDYSKGFELVQAWNLNVSFNHLDVYGYAAHALILRTESYLNNISYNNITTHASAYAYALYIIGANNNTISYNNISNPSGGGSINHVVWDEGSNYNQYSHNNLSAADYLADCLHIVNSNVTMSNDNLTCSGCRYAVGADSSGASAILNNVTFLRSKLTGNTTVRWYVDVFANYSNGSGAIGFSLNASNASSVPYYSVLPTTDSSGFSRLSLPEFWGSNYTVALLYPNGTVSNSSAVNVSQISTAPRDFSILFATGAQAEGGAPAGTPVSACRDLNASGTVYQLSGNISWDAGRTHCFVVTATNVTLDLAGYTISGDATDGHYCVYTDQNATTVRGGNISNCARAVYAAANFTTVFNTTILTAASMTYSRGVYVSGGWYANVTRNNISVTGTYGRGVYATGAVGTSVSYNNVTAYADNSHGVFFDSSSLNSSAFYNNVTTMGASSHGIYDYYYSTGADIYSNTVNVSGSSAYGIFIDNNADDASVWGNDIHSSDRAVYVYISDRVNISANAINVSGTAHGINVYYYCDLAKVSYNSVFAPNAYPNGIYIDYYSTNASVWKNNVTILGNSAYGITVTSSSDNANVSANNITVKGDTNYGIRILSSSANANVTWNNITTNPGNTGVWNSRGIIVDASTGANVSYNSVSTKGTWGIGAYINNLAHNAYFYGNNVSTYGSYGYGLLVEITNNATISYNNMTCTSPDSSSHCIYVYRFSNNSIVSYNTVILPSAASWSYGVILDWAVFNATVTRNNVTTSGEVDAGVRCLSAHNSNITYNNITTLQSWSRGVHLTDGSNNDTITYNTIVTAGYAGRGVEIDNLINNTNVSFNDITTTGDVGHGVAVYTRSSNDTISWNTIRTGGGYGYGVTVSDASWGIMILRNNITTGVVGAGGNARGIVLEGWANNVTAMYNNVTTYTAGSRGIVLDPAQYSHFYYNTVETFGTWSEALVTFSASPNNTFVGNNVSGHSGTVGYGTVLYGADLVFENNTVRSWASWGAVFQDVRRMRARWNDIASYCAWVPTVRVHNLSDSLLSWNNITQYGANYAALESISGSYNDTVERNNITAIAGGANGIEIRDGSHNFSVRNNNVTTAVAGGCLLRVMEANTANNSFSQNNLTALVANSVGIHLGNYAFDNNFTENNVTLLGSSGDYGESVRAYQGTYNNRFYRNTFSQRYFWFYNAAGYYWGADPGGANTSTLFYDDNLSCSGCTTHFYLTYSANATVTNVTFDRAKLDIQSAADKQPFSPNALFVRWYAYPYVTLSSSPVSGVTVNATNAVAGYSWFNEANATGSNGKALVTAFEGIYNSTGYFNYTPHTFEALDEFGGAANYNTSAITTGGIVVPIVYPDLAAAVPLTDASCKEAEGARLPPVAA